MNITAPFKLRGLRAGDERSSSAPNWPAPPTPEVRGRPHHRREFRRRRPDQRHPAQSRLPDGRQARADARRRRRGARRAAAVPAQRAGRAGCWRTATSSKAAALAAEFAGAVRVVAAAATAILTDERFDLVVNATSASLTGELPPVPPRRLQRREAGLRTRLRQGTHALPAARAATRACRSSPTASACWSSRRRKPSSWWRGVRPDTRAGHRPAYGAPRLNASGGCQ